MADASQFEVAAGATQQEVLKQLVTGVSELVRMMPEDIVGDEANKDRINDALQAQIDVITAADTQAKRTKVAKPLTPMPTFGNRHEIERIKVVHIPECSGTKSQTEVLSYLEKMMDLVTANTLTEDAAKQLLKTRATDLLYSSISQMTRDGCNLETMVSLLEVQFAGVVPPQEAKSKCAKLERQAGETISGFAIRLRKMAHIAARDEATDDAKRAMEVELTSTNLRRALPPSVKQTLEERELTHRADGRPEWTLHELICQCELIDSRRQDKLAHMAEKRHYRPSRPKNEYVRLLEEGSGSESDDGNEQFYESLEPTSDSDSSIDGEEAVALIKAVHEVERRGAKGRDKRKIIGKAMNRVFRGRAMPKMYVPPPGPPRLLREVQVARRDLPRLANVDKDQCLQCGKATNPPHKAKGDRCALRDKELTDRPCVKCGKGLHQADDCLVAIQGQYKAEAAKNVE